MYTVRHYHHQIRNKVESYLAIKYGMTLDQTVATDYVASDATVVWNATTNSTHNNDIAGIGQDDEASLNQLQSQSINTDYIVTISNASALTNFEYLVWGNDDGAVGILSSEVPAGIPATADGRLTREWRVDETGDVGTVTIAFELSQQGALRKDGVASDYALLIDADGDFSNATVHTAGAAINGTEISFTGVDFTDGYYFSLAGPEVISPGAVKPSLMLWYKADAGVTTSGISVTAWTDQSTSGNDATVISSYSPDLADGAINYNPTLDASAKKALFNLDQTIDAQNSFVVATYTQAPALYSVILGHNSGAHGAWYSGPNRYLVNAYSEAGFTTGAWTVNATSVTPTTTIPPVDEPQIIAVDAGGAVADVQSILGDYNYPTLNRNFTGKISEIVLYNNSNTALDVSKIQTYLAIKYGITLSNDYINTDGTTIYDVSTYSNQIIGIGRDDAEGLLQKQSHSTDDTVRIFMNTLAVDNGSNTTTVADFGADLAYIVAGHDNGSMCPTAASNAETPAGVSTRIEREWKVTNTNFTGTFSFEIDTAVCGQAITLADLKLLVDDDGDFTDAQVLGTADGLTFSFGSVIVSGISTSHIPTNSTRYITIALESTPLEVKIANFKATPAQNKVKLEWTTIKESNNAVYTIQRSKNGTGLEDVVTVKGVSNNQSFIDYEAFDLNPYPGYSYYRLMVKDLGGGITYSDLEAVNFDPLLDVQIHPNPAHHRLVVEGENIQLAKIRITDGIGKEVKLNPRMHHNKVVYHISNLDSGIYYVSIHQDGKVMTKKITKK